MEKECTKCNALKLIEDFYVRSSGRVDCWCKPCYKLHYSEYFKKNKQKRTKSMWSYQKERLQKDSSFKLAQNLRSRLWHAVKNNQKSGSAVVNLGCSVEEFKVHLESKFQPGMSWSNYGKWHVDHVKAISNFDLANPSQVKDACHFSNLQPLWENDNLKKGSR